MANYLIVRRKADYPSDASRPRIVGGLKQAATNFGLGEVELLDLQNGSPFAWLEEEELILEYWLTNLKPGDTVVFRALASISDDPQIAVAALGAVIGNGVRVIILELGGDAAPHLTAMNAVVRQSGSYEARVIMAEEAVATAEARIWAEADAMYREVLAHMARAGHMVQWPQPAAQEPEDAEIGQYLRLMRQRANHSQRSLADAIGGRQYQVSRMEASGRGELLQSAVRELDPEWKGNPANPAELRARALQVLAAEAGAAAA